MHFRTSSAGLWFNQCLRAFGTEGQRQNEKAGRRATAIDRTASENQGGRGTLVVTTIGFCSGTVTVPYTFTIPDATTLLGNLTLFFTIPTPANVMVPLSCTGPMGGVNTSTNNPATILAVYPNEISVGSVPGTVTQHLTGNISYSYIIT